MAEEVLMEQVQQKIWREGMGEGLEEDKLTHEEYTDQ